MGAGYGVCGVRLGGGGVPVSGQRWAWGRFVSIGGGEGEGRTRSCSTVTYREKADEDGEGGRQEGNVLYSKQKTRKEETQQERGLAYKSARVEGREGG